MSASSKNFEIETVFNKNATNPHLIGNNKTVTINGISLSGKYASDYTLTSTTAKTQANITMPSNNTSPSSNQLVTPVVLPTTPHSTVITTPNGSNQFGLASAEDLDETSELCVVNSENCECIQNELNKDESDTQICYERPDHH
jgi:hypothetical protein